MAIKNPLMFITVEEFKESNYFNNTLFDDITTPDNDIWLAITQASDCVNYASGNNISTKWPELEPTEFTDIVQTATAHQVRFILGKGVDYMRAQASIAQGGITYQQTNPNDPYYIVPEVYINLSKIKERLTFQGFAINVKPYQSNSFISAKNDNNFFESYLRITNLQSNDVRTKIIKTNPIGIIGTTITIDTNNIKSIDNLTTEELFTQYFSNDSMQLVDGKMGQKEKVISLNNNVSNILINQLEYNTLQTNNKTVSGAINEIKNNSRDSIWNSTSTDANLKWARDINLQGWNLTRVGDPKLEDDAANKRYIDKKLENKVDIDKFKYAFAVNALGTDNPALQTTDKTIVGAINELKSKIKDKKFANKYFKYNTETNEITLHDEENSLLCKDLFENNEYKLLKTKNKKLLQAINEILEKQPNSSKWKEVGTKLNINHIQYDFKPNNKYKIYYNFENQISSKKYIFICKEFLYGELNTDIQSLDWDNVNNRIMVSLQLQNNTIYTISNSGKFQYGQLLKLEELQGSD